MEKPRDYENNREKKKKHASLDFVTICSPNLAKESIYTQNNQYIGKFRIKNDKVTNKLYTIEN